MQQLRVRTASKLSLLSLAVPASLIFAGACGAQVAPQQAAQDVNSADSSVDSLQANDLLGSDAPAADQTASEADVQPAEISFGDGAAGDGVLVDDCPGGPGCTCEQNSDCDTSLCIETPDGKQCARNCLEDCPDGFSCKPVTGPGGDPVTICIPKWARLCDPCTASKDCVALGISDSKCIDQGAVGSFCGIKCVGDLGCPTGYACKTAKTVEGGDEKLCVRNPPADSKGPYGLCDCSVRAKTLSLQTTCSTAKLDGGKQLLCKGTRACGAAGLGDCTAGDPEKELCDGIDNDCDGDVDEDSCDDGNACTSEACAGAKGCVKQDLAGADCDDNNACTVADKCVSGLCVPGAPKSCDDGNPCTKDACNMAAGCTQTADDNKPCDDENPCTLGDTCSAQVCKAGKNKECTVQDPCLVAACNLADGKCKYDNATTGKSCDDADACTSDDGCASGSCKGAKKIVCDDKDPCTDDACDGTKGCVTKPNSAACEDGNACTVGDKCDSGACKAGGPKACDDGNVCTEGESCAEGQCVIGIAKQCDDGNVCTDDSCDSAKGCVTKPKYSGACDADGTLCTVSDACDAGVCKAGALKVCDDKNPCTKGTCNPDTGACFYLPLPDDTACGPDGAKCKIATCIPGCKPEHAKKCHNEAVWWFDSCGKPSKVVQDCAGFTFCADADCSKGVVDGNYLVNADPDTQSTPLGPAKFVPVIVAVKDWGPFVQGDFAVGGQKVQLTGKLIGKIWTSKGTFTQAAGAGLTVQHAFTMTVTFGVNPKKSSKPLPDFFSGTIIDDMSASGFALGQVLWKITGIKQ